MPRSPNRGIAVMNLIILRPLRCKGRHQFILLLQTVPASWTMIYRAANVMSCASVVLVQPYYCLLLTPANGTQDYSNSVVGFVLLHLLVSSTAACPSTPKMRALSKRNRTPQLCIYSIVRNVFSLMGQSHRVTAVLLLSGQGSE